MGVPSGAINEVQIEPDLDEAHAALDQSPAEQAALSELIAIFVAQGAGLGREIERLHKVATLELEAFADRVVVVADDFLVGVPFGKLVAQAGEQRFTPRGALGRDLRRACQSGGAARGIGQIDVARLRTKKARTTMST